MVKLNSLGNGSNQEANLLGSLSRTTHCLPLSTDLPLFLHFWAALGYLLEIVIPNPTPNVEYYPPH